MNSSQRGHMTMKSSALAPTAMSYMGQDLILNHMKSHYRRISSAKASVDTAAPKSMKKHIRVRDQKKREGSKSQMEGPLTPGRRARRTSVENLSMFTPSPSPRSRPSSSRQHYRSNSANTRSPYRPQSATGGTPKNSTPAPSPRLDQDDPAYLEKTIQRETPIKSTRAPSQNSNFSPRVLPGPLVSHTRRKTVENKEGPGYRTPRSAREEYQVARRDRVSAFKVERQPGVSQEYGSTYRGLGRDLSIDLPQEGGYDDGQFNSYRSGRASTRLNSSRSARVTTPLQRRLREEKEIETKMWEDEQLYMQFVSDVTSDILSRGIFTNRVLDKVFESHIDKRKDELNEERMRAMIDQLRVDLGVES